MSNRKDKSTEEDIHKDDREGQDSNNHQNGDGGQSGSRPTMSELSKRAARFVTDYPVGTPIPQPVRTQAAGSTGVIPNGTVSHTFKQAGVCVLDWLPTCGVIDSDTDPANRAWRNLYTVTTQQTTSLKAFEASDLAIRCMAVDSLYGYYFNTMRLYGLISDYRKENRYYPRAIFTALGVDYDDWMANKAVIDTYLVEMAYQMSSMPQPSGFELFKYHLDINSNLYKDGDSVHSQIYAFRQKAFYSYEVVDQVKGLSLISPYSGSSLVTWRNWRIVWEQLFNALANSSDVDIMNAFILRAWGDSLIKIPVIPSDFKTNIEKDDNMLLTINNAVIVQADVDSLRIYDAGNGNLRSHPVVSAANDDNIFGKMESIHNNVWYLNFVDTSPTEEEVAAAARMHTMVSSSTRDIVALGTELVVGLRLHTLGLGIYDAYAVDITADDNTSKWDTLEYGGSTLLIFDSTFTNVLAFSTGGDNEGIRPKVFIELAVLSQFDWAPAIYPCFFIPYNASTAGGNGNLNASTIFPAFHDTQNMVPISASPMENLFEALIMDSLGMSDI